MNFLGRDHKIEEAVAGADRSEFYYGLFCTDKKRRETPAAVYYTRFAAQKKCQELNPPGSEPRWFIRMIEVPC
jgi:hypothetical protein